MEILSLVIAFTAAIIIAYAVLYILGKLWSIASFLLMILAIFWILRHFGVIA